MSTAAPLAPFFSTVTVMVLSLPKEFNQECMIADATPDEAIAKAHAFFHLRHHLPVSWLICARSAEIYGAQLRAWKQEYGDEIGIYEPSLIGTELIMPGVQTWLEELGIPRPRANNKYGFLCWAEVDEATQTAIFTHLKAKFDAIFNQDTKLIYAANGGAATVRAMKNCGLSILWGYNWNLYGDVVDSTGRGALPYPFYVSEHHAKAATDRSDDAVLGVQWGSGDLVNNFCTARQAHIAMNRVCLNAHELANRSGAVPKQEFIERFYQQVAESRAWNPFAYVPLQIEAVWLAEDGVCFGQHPAYNSRTTEIFYHLVETGLRYGARYVTHEAFRAWYCENFATTPEMLLYYEDLIPGRKICGKDQDFAPMVVLGSREGQWIFLKSSGFNPVRSYSYRPQAAEDDPRLEYPYALEPDVELRVKEWTTPSFGVQITPEGVHYRSQEWCLTARSPQPDYKTILWSVNLPSYLGAADLRTSSNIKRVRLLPEKNLAIVEAALEPGDNDLLLESDLPGRYIRMEAPVRCGRRIEVYLHNDGPEVGVSLLQAKIGEKLRLGGMWWDGEYFESQNHFNHSWYDWRTGIIQVRTGYPDAIRLRSGATRVSFEVLGTL